MMKQAIITFIVAICLSGCASQILQSYVGKSVTEPILDYGPPASVVELAENRRAFQWQIDSSGIVPISTPTTASVYGPGGLTTVTSSSTSYLPYSQSCLYTLLATRSEDDWIVDSFREPTFGCE